MEAIEELALGVSASMRLSRGSALAEGAWLVYAGMLSPGVFSLIVQAHTAWYRG